MYILKIPVGNNIQIEGETEKPLSLKGTGNLINKGDFYTKNSTNGTSTEKETHLPYNNLALGFRARQYGDNCTGISLLRGAYNPTTGAIVNSGWYVDTDNTLNYEGWDVQAPSGAVMWSLAVRSHPDDFRTVVMRYAFYNQTTRRLDAPPNASYTDYGGTVPSESGWNPYYRGEQYYDPNEFSLDEDRTVITGLGFIISSGNVTRMQVSLAYLP